MVGFELGSVPFNNDGWGPPDSTSIPFASFSRSETRPIKLTDQAPLQPSSWALNLKQPLRLAFDRATTHISAEDLLPPRPTHKLHNTQNPLSNPRWNNRFNQTASIHSRSSSTGIPPHCLLEENLQYSTSVDIQPEWNMLDQIPFSTFPSYPSPECLERCLKTGFFWVTTTDDPVIHAWLRSDKATVFATDSILSTLMCAPRSVYSWDIVVQRVGNKLFLDKRDGSNLDLLSVHETSQEPLPDVKDDINLGFYP
ncbi:hypothetical protein Leryth_027444 [Lithospermum erythrorhizon]|nr:hypothetical protein Leryth_027444 [Lithospermum erythrorhizon]